MAKGAIVPVSKPFAKILSAKRDHFNGLVDLARASGGAFDNASFSQFVSTDVDAIVQSVVAVNPEAAPRVTLDVFEMAVRLVAQHRAGPTARHGIVNKVWRDIAPKMAHLIVLDAVESLGALTNAATFLHGLPTVRTDEWLDKLAHSVSQVSTSEDLRHLVTLTTWCSGAPHMRDTALKSAERLPAALVLEVVGAEGDLTWKQTARELRDDIWWRPSERDRSMQHRIGGFTGLGGPFSTPPHAIATDDGFVVQSGDRFFHIIVDAFGAVVLSAQEDDWLSKNVTSERDAPVLEGSILQSGDVSVEVALPEDKLALCFNKESIAVVSPHSHWMFVFPRHLSA